MESSVGHEASVDQESCLFFVGADDAARGVYRPTGYELHLTGGGVDRQHLTHLHEIHHKVLNDDTGWGTALHITARHEPWSTQVFPALLEACRTVHESFASFMAINLAATRHDSIEAAMSAYPDYAQFAARMQRLLHGVPAGHRQDLAATGIARFCMSGPILNYLADSYPSALVMSRVRGIDRPDVRFAMCQSVSGKAVEGGVAAADDAFEAQVGRNVEELGLDADDATLDEAWRVWEETFTQTLLRSHRRLRNVRVPDRNAHLVDAIALAGRLAADGFELDLPMASAEDLPASDPESVQRLLTAVSIPLRPERWPALTATLGKQIEVADLAALLTATTGARPHLEVMAHLSSHLLGDYEFSARDSDRLAPLDPTPVFAVRAIIDDDGRGTILHTVLPGPDHYEAIVAAWNGRGPIVNCVAASCFVETAWQSKWLPTLRQNPTIVLVDCGLLGMVGSGRLLGDHQLVWGSYLDLDHSYLKALVWHVDTHPHVMLAIGDDLTIQLIAGQLTDLLDNRLGMHDSDWSAWRDALGAATASILRTSSALRFAGARRAR